MVFKNPFVTKVALSAQTLDFIQMLLSAYEVRALYVFSVTLPGHVFKQQEIALLTHEETLKGDMQCIYCKVLTLSAYV